MSYLDKLKSLLPKEQYDKVVADLDGKQLIINDGNYIPKAKFDAKNEEAKTLEAQVTTLKTNISETEAKLKEFEKLESTNNELKTQITELNAKNQQIVKESDEKVAQAKTEADQKVQQLTIDSKVKMALINEGASADASQVAVKANLDMSKITLDGDNLIGLTDQLTPLKESSPNLFFGTKSKDEKDDGKQTQVKGTKYVKGKESKSQQTEDPLDAMSSIYKNNHQEA